MIIRKWRLLKNSDTIQQGDQRLDDDCETWHEVESFCFGIDYTPTLFVPIRRLVDVAEAFQDEPTTA